MPKTRVAVCSCECGRQIWWNWGLDSRRANLNRSEWNQREEATNQTVCLYRGATVINTPHPPFLSFQTELFLKFAKQIFFLRLLIIENRRVWMTPQIFAHIGLLVIKRPPPPLVLLQRDIGTLCKSPLIESNLTNDSLTLLCCYQSHSSIGDYVTNWLLILSSKFF